MRNETIFVCSHYAFMQRHADSKLALIVEDEVLIAMEIEALLVTQGFLCETTTNLANMKEMPLDSLAIAIVDLRLQERLEGQNVIRYLRERIPRLPVVVVTGYGAISSETDLRGLGGPTRRLHKPVAPPELSRAVWDVIDEAQTGVAPSWRRRAAD